VRSHDLVVPAGLLANIEVLLTDKTGTLTEGRLSFAAALDAAGNAADELLRLGAGAASLFLSFLPLLPT
jgi:Mg2+-importing ATPase